MEVNFQQKLLKELKDYDLLKDSFGKIYKAESEKSEKRKVLFGDIGKIKDFEKNQQLSEIYDKLKNEMIDIEIEKKNQLMKIKSNLVPGLNYAISTNKNYQKYLGRYKPEFQVNAENRNNNTNNNQGKDEFYHPGINLNNDIIQYEKKRMDNKFFFLHFLHYELAYHTKAVEKLTELYKIIKEFNEDSNNKKVKKELNKSSDINNNVKEPELNHTNESNHNEI